MNRSTKKILAAMVTLLIILVIVIVVLAVTNKPVKTAEEMGETVIGEQAAATPTETPLTEEEPQTEAESEATSIDLPNEKEVRLYVGGGGTMEVVSSYNSTWSVDEDIATFEAINSSEDVIYYDNYYTLHEDYWNAVDTDTEYKIGYELSFNVGDEQKLITILEPSDISGNADLFMGDAANDEVTGYLGAWVYYDMGQSGTYVHLTQADMTEDVLLTSIKLRPTPQSDQISNLTLRVFSYSSDDEFNSQGHYIGTHAYEISINNQ